ncbi:hypothetical protein [Streptomyces murinus]|uniref:hypothetical protein n=1 Tax=Streptomyces murinus TaxID=33900 RepID=UPI003F45D5FB
MDRAINDFLTARATPAGPGLRAIAVDGKALRNLAIGVHRQNGHTNIAAALRHTARDRRKPLAALGLTG